MLGHGVAFELDVLSTVAATQVQNQARKAAKMSANPALDTAEVAGSRPCGRGGKGRGRGRGRARVGRSAVQPSEAVGEGAGDEDLEEEDEALEDETREEAKICVKRPAAQLKATAKWATDSKGRKKDKQQDSTGSHVLECVLLGSVM